MLTTTLPATGASQDMGAMPSVFTLEPGEFVHINKARARAGAGAGAGARARAMAMART